MVGTAERLPAAGDFDMVVEHPNNFGPPMVRLAVFDSSGVILDQRVVVINYDIAVDASEPRIVTFETESDVLDEAALANGSARLNVTWDVANRLPDSNLVFEQVLEGGRIVSAELPRPNVWVPSQGEGQLAPVLPGAGMPVRLQMRVVDMVDGATLAEVALPPIPVEESVAPVVVEEPTGQEDSAPVDVTQPAPVIVMFTAAPEIVGRGDTVTVTWDVRNAQDIGVWLLEPGGPLSQAAPDPAAGSWTITLPEFYVDSATFMLYVTGLDGSQIQDSLTVDVICPFSYFFGPTSESLTCPETNVTSVQAAFQSFQNGYMIWRADTSDIYVLYNSGLVNRYKDSWQGEILYFDQEAPEGVYRPDRGFGKVWIENPQVRAGLGWATDFEQGYTMRYQRSGDVKYARLYMDMPDGSVIYLVENTWKFLGQ
ncbi:MAG TPA: hypothetical protein ENO21_02865 [Firmicutes bacterium]|nr:hypothetical protein [Bacillota bacterium]